MNINNQFTINQKKINKFYIKRNNKINNFFY